MCKSGSARGVISLVEIAFSNRRKPVFFFALRRDYSKIQILTIEELLHEQKRLEMPQEWGTFKQAQKVSRPEAEQPELGL